MFTSNWKSKNNYINFHKKGLIIKLGDALKMDIKRIKEKLKLIEKKALLSEIIIIIKLKKYLKHEPVNKGNN